MRHRAFRLAVLCLTIIVGCTKSHLGVNDRLPNFTFYDTDSQPVKIYNFLAPGKLLLLHFWGAGCCLTYSVPTMNAVTAIDRSSEYRHVTVVSVNLDYPAGKVQRAVNSHGVTQMVLNDTEDQFYDAAPELENVFPLAMILVVDDQGIIQNKILGPQLLPAISELVARPRSS